MLGMDKPQDPKTKGVQTSFSPQHTKGLLGHLLMLEKPSATYYLTNLNNILSFQRLFYCKNIVFCI